MVEEGHVGMHKRPCGAEEVCGRSLIDGVEDEEVEVGGVDEVLACEVGGANACHFLTPQRTGADGAWRS